MGSLAAAHATCGAALDGWASRHTLLRRALDQRLAGEVAAAAESYGVWERLDMRPQPTEAKPRKVGLYYTKEEYDADPTLLHTRAASPAQRGPWRRHRGGASGP